jgi:AcrR family transcriptional regulator
MSGPPVDFDDRTERVASVERRPGRPRSLACDQAILRAALDEYAERGYEGLSVDAVAARAGVSKATIYRRYQGKTDLVMAAAKGVVYDEWEPPSGDDLRSDLRALLDHLRTVMFGTTAGRAARMVVADSLSHPDLADAFHGLVAQRRALTRGIIEDAVERGELAPHVDAEVVTDMLAGSVFYRLFISGDPVDDAFLDTVVDTALRAGRIG